MTTEGANQVETTGETVGEAKWAALRELEKLYPGLDKSVVRFQVLSEGERGLLGACGGDDRRGVSRDPAYAGGRGPDAGP